MVQVVRISISPFDFGREISRDHRVVCATHALEAVSTIAWHPRLLGENPVVYSDNSDYFVVIFADGFGLNIRRFRYDINLAQPASVATILIDRANHHRLCRNGTHDDVQRLLKIRSSFDACSPRGERLRPLLWTTVPYTFSFFYIGGSLAGHRTQAYDANIAALLEPSRVLTSELLDDGHSREEACTQKIIKLKGHLSIDDMANCDIRSDSTLLASWASLVMFDSYNDSLAYLESLEMRLQNCWLRAHFIRRYADSLLDERRPEPAHLTDFTRQVRPLLRQSQRLIDAATSTRDQTIFDRLCDTSDLTREIQSAEDAIEDVQTNVTALNSRRIKYYDTSVQALLILLALAQLVPIFFKVPLIPTPDIYAVIPAALGLMIVLGLFWFRKG